MTDTIPHTEARFVWSAAHPDRFRVVLPPQHKSIASHWGGVVGWHGPARSDAMLCGGDGDPLTGNAYVNKLNELFVWWTTDCGLDPHVVRRELNRVDLWREQWQPHG